jgi:hypothetical protein
VQWVDELIRADKKITIDCSNCTRVFPSFSIHNNACSFEVSESLCVVGAQRTEGLRKNELNGPVLAASVNGMHMNEKISVIGLLLRTIHGRITTNLNQSVLQCNGNIPVHLQPKNLRLCQQLGR